MGNLYIYSNIFNHWDYLKDSGILSNERIDEAKRFVSPETFGPAKLEGGGVIIDWILHKPTGLLINDWQYKNLTHCMYNSIFEKFFTDDEVEKLNKDANRIWRKKEDERRFSIAEKIKEENWDGPVYWEGMGDDGYFRDIDDFRESIYEWDEEGYPYPEYIWACKEVPSCFIDFDDILDRATEDAYDDFDFNDIEGGKELEKAINIFNKLNSHLVSWEPNFKKVILLNELYH